MKTCSRLFILLLLALGLRPACAQGPDSLRVALDHLFAPLDKTQVPVPYLAEYGNRFTSLTPFNGTLTDSSVTTLTTWRLLYASVISGNVGRPSPLPVPATLNAALAAQVAATPATIPVVVQCLPYATLRPDARTAGLLSAANGQLFDVPGRPALPYLQRTLFAAAPARFQAPTGEVSFVFAPELHVSAGGTGVSNISALSLDFGDGRGYQPVAWNVPLSASYCTAGSKRVRVRATYGGVVPAPAGGRVQAAIAQPQAVSYESWFDLYVQTADCAAARYNQSDVAGLVQPFPARPGVHSGGTAYVRFGGSRSPGDQTIRRPLIVAEGYDGFSVAPAVYKRNYALKDFLDDIRGLNPNLNSLYSSLESAPGSVTGYDIVFLDYANGTDDIRRNAALFEDVVRWVNTVKQPVNGVRQQNVVLGVSMGGLVARYGLAELVKNPNLVNGVNLNDPDTRLLITHDSPHRGANTPLGIQMLTRQAAGSVAGQNIRFYNNIVTSPLFPSFFSASTIFPELQQADDLLDAPATEQLLLVRARRNGTGLFAQFSASYNSFVDTDYRSMITPASGQTFPYRFVATSLGSQCGTELFAPYTELIRVERSGYLGTIAQTTGYKTEVIVNAMPNGGQVERIASLRIWNETRILGISTGRIYLTNHSFNSPSSNPIAWDGLPGGTQPVRGNVDLPQGGSYFDRLALVFAWGNSSNTYLADDFCFVPRASALDVQTFDANSLRGIYVNDVTNGSATRAERAIAQEFNPFQGQPRNAAHPFFPGRQAQWIFNEMQGQSNAQACSNECNPVTVTTGPYNGSVCSGTDITFRANNIPVDATVTWTAQGGSVNTGTGLTFVTSPNGMDDRVMAEATILTAGGCTFVRNSSVLVGPPPQSAEPICGYYSSGGGGSGFSIPPVPSATSYRWTEHNDNLGASLPSVTSPYPQYFLGSVRFPNNVGVTITLTVEPINDCGIGPSTTAMLNLNSNGYGYLCSPFGRAGTAKTALTAVLYPNPARETVDVHIDNASIAHPVTVRLFDGYGQFRAEQTSTGAESVRLATAHLPAGLYFVHILRGQQVLSRQQLRIEK